MIYEQFGKQRENIARTAWRGERISIQAKGKPEFNQLFNDSGEALDIKTEGLYATTANYQKVLDVIAPYKPGKTDNLWLTIDVPADAPAGIYRSIDHSLVVEVLRLVLRPRKEWQFHLDLWQNPWAVARYHKVKPWSNEHFKFLKKHLCLLADAGQKVVTTTVVEDVWASQTYDSHGSMVEWCKNRNNISFDFSVFIRYVEACGEAGINGPIHVFSILPWGSTQGCGSKDGSVNYTFSDGFCMRASPGDEAYKFLWSTFLLDFTKMVREKGWVERVHFAFDERHVDEMMSAMEMLDTYLPNDFKPVRTASAFEYNLKYSDLITDLSPLFKKDVNWNQIAQERRSKGQKTTFYLCEWPKPPSANNFLMSVPHENKWVGWYAYANGLDGFLRWAFDSWPQDPLVRGDFPGPHGNWPAGDTFLSYPNGWSSRRLALLREGIQDYEKMLACGQHIDISSIVEPFIHADVIPAEMMENAQNLLDEACRVVCGTNAVSSYYIMRHAERFDHSYPKLWKECAKAAGHDERDTPISMGGKKQAMAAAEYLREKSIGAIYSSPYLRTLQTAAEVASGAGLKIMVEEGLSEGYHRKVTDPRTRPEFLPYIDSEYSSARTVTDKESYPLEFLGRTKDVGDYFKSLSGNMLIVSHAATSLALAAELCGKEPKEMGKIGACDILLVERIGGGGCRFVSRVNPHGMNTSTKAWGF